MGKREDYLGQYAKGWTAGDDEAILRVVDYTFTFDDPNAPRTVTKKEFAKYFATLTQTVNKLRGTNSPSKQPFMALTEVVTREDKDALTAWCWWSIPGTAIQGSGPIKVGDGGVLSEKIAYYTKLP